MENNASTQLLDQPKEKISFFGKGATYFGIVAINLVLTVVTIGLYYPWAKATYRKYVWNETEFKGSRFVFNGTGKEMFKGFLIAYLAFIGVYFLLTLMTGFLSYAWIGILVFYGLLLLFIPFAIFGAWRYRVTRTSWRGIYFSFDGQLKEFVKLFVVQGFLTIITFGIYYSWMRVKIQKYLFSHTSIGDLKLDFHGDGGELFGINILGGVLFYITLFLYVPIWMKQRFNFTIDNTTISDGTIRKRLKSTLENGEAWTTLVTNGLLLIVTLGIAFPWTFMRKTNMYFRNVELPVDFDYDNLAQSDGDFKDATADEMIDILDMGLDF